MPRSQAVEVIAQIDRAAGEEDLGAGRQADHPAPFPAACRTQRNALSLTCASTRMRAPFGRLISIRPAGWSWGPPGDGDRDGDGSDAGGSVGSSGVWPMMPTGTSSTGPAARPAARIAAAAFQADRQL